MEAISDYFALTDQTLREIGRCEFGTRESAILIVILRKSFLLCRAKAHFPKQRHIVKATGVRESHLSSALKRLIDWRVIEESPAGQWSILPVGYWKRASIGVRFDWSSDEQDNDDWLNLDPAQQELFPEPESLTDALRAVMISSRPALCPARTDRTEKGVMPQGLRVEKGVMPQGPLLAPHPGGPAGDFPEEVSSPVGESPSRAGEAKIALCDAAKNLPNREVLGETALCPEPKNLPDREVLDSKTYQIGKYLPNREVLEIEKGGETLDVIANLPNREVPPFKAFKASEFRALAFTSESLKPGGYQGGQPATRRGQKFSARVIAEYAAGMPETRPAKFPQDLEDELWELALAVIGEERARRWGGWYRRRIWWKPGKMKRVLLAVQEDMRPTSGIEVREVGKYACDTWYRFAD